jgi:hypothetical protein
MNTKLCAFVFVAAFVDSAGLAPAYAQQGDRRMVWTTFSIPESRTRVDYPTNVFSISEGKSENGVGERFRTSDGRALFSIYSKTNDAGETPRTYLNNNLRRPRSALQYERVTSSFFAISEETEDTIYYSRCNFSNNNRTIHCFDLVYPFREKKAWDRIVTRISRSLRPLRR